MATKEGGFPSNSQSHLENISSTGSQIPPHFRNNCFPFVVVAFPPPAFKTPSLTLSFLGLWVVGLKERAPSTTLVGGWSDQKHTEVRERAGGPVLEPGPVQGWGKVPAAHASDTLHTACLWSEFSGCGQCGGGRSGKGSGRSSWEEWMEEDRGNFQRRGVRGESLDWKCR